MTINSFKSLFSLVSWKSLKSYLYANPPVFALFFFAIAVIIKCCLIAINIFSDTSRIHLLYSLPVLLFSDLAVSFFVYLVFDILIQKLAKHKIQALVKIVNATSFILYSFLIFYSVLMIKFYSLFGNVLSYELMQLAHSADKFSNSFANEIDLLTVALIILSFLFAFFFIRYYGKFNTFLQSTLMQPVNRVRKLSIVFVIFVSFVYSGINQQNYHSVDKNSLATIVLSLARNLAYQSESNSGLLAKSSLGSNYLFSVTDPHKRVKAIPVKGSPAFGKNMNVIFYKIESTAKNYVGFFNKDNEDVTPNLNELSKNSLLMANHYSPEPASIKALYSVLTGKFPYSTRNWSEFLQRAKTSETLASILKKKNYYSLFLFSGNGEIYYQKKLMNATFDKFIDRKEILRRKMPYKDFKICIDDRVLIPLFEDFLKEKREKFFVFINPVLPHHPYNTPGKSFNVRSPKRKYNRYLNSLHYSDHVVGEIYKLLKKYGRDKDTLFVIHSDHGEAFYQHPQNYLHSLYLYEENVSTFAMFVNPILFPKKQLYNGITSHMDLLPTVLDIMDIKFTGNMDGISVVSNHPQKIAAFFTSFATTYYGLRDGPYKYIYNRDYNTHELYNLIDDPKEKTNLGSKQPELIDKFRERLKHIEEYVK